MVHRAHLHDALYQRALELGVLVSLDCTVAGYDPRKGSVVLVDGTVVQGDLVIAADGMLRELSILGRRL